MNFLAHAWLAGPKPTDIVGGLMGDFVKGPLPGHLSPELAAGVALHRAIDSYAERHPAFQASRARISPLRRRYGGIMVDMFYDHFLANHWSEWHPEPLAQFTQAVYQLLNSYWRVLPEAMGPVVQAMSRDDWLSAYRHRADIGYALDRMAQRRLKHANPLAGGGDELQQHYSAFHQDFQVFMSDAREYGRAWRQQHLSAYRSATSSP